MTTTPWQFHHTVDCNTPLSFAWTFWTDVANWARIEGNAVQWIRLNGPFQVGTTGITKMPNNPAQTWHITEVIPEKSATIVMSLDGADFVNTMIMEQVSEKKIKISQRLYLQGSKANDYLDGIKIFEQSAPQGLFKLAAVIESTYNRSIHPN